MLSTSVVGYSQTQLIACVFILVINTNTADCLCLYCSHQHSFSRSQLIACVFTVNTVTHEHESFFNSVQITLIHLSLIVPQMSQVRSHTLSLNRPFETFQAKCLA